MRLALWRSLFSLAVTASARFPHLVPPLVVQWAEDGFYDAGLRETLTRSTAEYREATADTIPAPAGEWVGLCGDAPHCEPGDGLHDETPWPSSRQRMEA